MLQVLIPVLAGLSALALGSAIIVGRLARQAPVQARLREIEAGISTVVLPRPASFKTFLERLGKIVMAPRESTTLKQQLATAGFNSRAAPTLYLGIKVVLFAIGLPLFIAGVLLLRLPGPVQFIVASVGALILFFLPNMVVSSCLSKRSHDIQSHLPDAIDLLEISVSAGMGLDQAWNSVSTEIRNVSPILADEMALANLEMHLGATRAVALRHMAQRTGADDLASLVAILVESERFGTSTSDALRTFASSLREVRSVRAQERAEKMAVKMIFPLVLFIFPPVLIVMAGPAVITLAKALGDAK